MECKLAFDWLSLKRVIKTRWGETEGKLNSDFEVASVAPSRVSRRGAFLHAFQAVVVAERIK